DRKSIDVNLETSDGLISLTFDAEALRRLVSSVTAIQAQMASNAETTYVGIPAEVVAAERSGHMVLSFRMTNGVEHHMALTVEQAAQFSADLTGFLRKRRS